MSVVGLFKPFHNFYVIRSTFLSGKHTIRFVDVKQVLGCLNRLKSVSNHDYSNIRLLLFLYLWDGCLHFSLTFGVESRCSLVEDENLRLLDKSSRNRNSLLLATWKVQNAARPNVGVEPTLQFVHKSSVCSLESNCHVFFSRILVAKEKVVSDSPKDKHWLLRHVANYTSQSG